MNGSGSRRPTPVSDVLAAVIRQAGIEERVEQASVLPEWPELAASGVGLLRLYPRQYGTAEALRRFDAVRRGGVVPSRQPGCTAGYWTGLPGMQTP